MAAVKVGLIVSDFPLIAFVWVLLLEAALVFAGLFAIYGKKVQRPWRWRASIERGRALLRDAWPLMISGIAFMGYMRVDQIMLGDMVGSGAVGIYSAALRISELWAVFATVIVSSVFPAIIRSERKSEAVFSYRIRRLLRILSWFAILMAMVVTLSADWIVHTLFGSDYSESTNVLRIHIWAGVFVFMGHVGGKWYIIKKLQRVSMQRSIVGLAVNVVLNALLIPWYGVVGAASASFLTMLIVFYAYDALNSETRDLFYMKTNSILLFRKV
jgi:PST family polysaccharide transporter